MQVLKFGGTSVANSANMARVVDIVSKAVDRDRTILVCSAISGFTDALIRIGNLAAKRDDDYRAIIDEYQKSTTPSSKNCSLWRNMRKAWRYVTVCSNPCGASPRASIFWAN